MLKRAIVIGCLTLLMAGLAWSAEDAFQFPEDMQKLWPADPAFIVAITSVNDLDRQWRTIEEMLNEGDGEPTDLIGMISEKMPQFAQTVDLDRPLAMATGLPDFMSGGDPPLTFIVPLSGALNDEARMELEEEGLTQVIQGDYLAFSLDPAYAPAAVVPDLAQGLNPGFITSRLDLEMVVAAYRPLAEMSMGAMTAPPAEPDTTESGEIRPNRGMDQEEAVAIKNLAQAIMDSARRLDLALQIEEETLTLHSGFSVFPDSPLDPGPQPSFEDALQLTRLLPRGGNIIQAQALDQTRQFEVFRDFYVQSMEKGMAELPPDQADAFRAWMNLYLDSVDLFNNPMAASVEMSDESMSANVVMECADAPGSLERIAGLFAGLSDADMGIKFKKMPTGKVAGVEVRSWTIQYDADKLAGLSADPTPSKMGAPHMEAEQMIAFLRKVTPNINMAVRGNHLIISADTNPANLAHMIQEAGQRRGAANPVVSAVAAKAGPAVQQVVTGDLMAIIAWMTEWMEEIEEEEYTAIKGNPIPFSSSVTIDGASYGGQWTMDMPAVKRLVKAFQELEEMKRGAARNDDDSDKEEETETE